MRSLRARQALWDDLAEGFECDDGSVPELLIAGIAPESAAWMFDELRALAEPLPDDQTAEFVDTASVRLIVELENPGMLAATGVINLHCLMVGICWDGVRLPDIGVSVYQDSIAVDYQMGPGWNPDAVAAFVELLDHLARHDPGAGLEGRHFTSTAQTGFQETISRYLAS